MGNIDRRLEKLERRLAPSKAEQTHRARREFLGRLTDEELYWLAEPFDQAENSAESPQLEAQRHQRWKSLLERKEEIMSREMQR